MKSQLTKYFNAIAKGTSSGGTFTAPVIAAPAAPPAEVEPDIEDFTRTLRREIVNRSNYTKADGELLGFERAGS